MKSSKYKLLRRFSTPTVNDYGVNKLYKASDQRVWMEKCSHCGTYQKLDYETSIKQVGPDSGIDAIGKVIQPGTFAFVCKHCGKPLDRWYGGKWVITHPGQGRSHGYLISQLNAIWITPDALKEDEMRYPSKQTFYNYVLGEPYEDVSQKFYSTDVTDNMEDRERPRNRDGYKFISAGIDWGGPVHHIVILGLTTEGKIELVDLHKVNKSIGVEHIEEDINEVIQELNKYQPDIIIPDLGSSGNYVDILKKYYGTSKVFGVKTRSALTNNDPNAYFNDNAGIVTIDKLTQFVMMMSNMRRGDIRFWGKLDSDLRLYITHWDNVVIRTDEETDNVSHSVKYVKRILRKDGDHFAAASVYSMIGLRHLLDLLNETKQSPLSVSYLEDNLGKPTATDLIREKDIKF